MKLLLFFLTLTLNAQITPKDFQEFFKLQKDLQSDKNQIKAINLIYKLGYPEKAKQKLYLMLSQTDKKNIKSKLLVIFNNLEKKSFDNSIINSIAYILNNYDKNPKDKEIIEIYQSKFRKKTIKKETEKIEKKEFSNNIKKTKKNNNHDTEDFDKTIETAIVLSEWLDDLDTDNSINYLSLLNDEKYFRVLYEYLIYTKTKNSNRLEKLNFKTPEYYHFMISVYKQKQNKEKSLFYLKKLNKEFPYYLKYNRIVP